MSLYPSRITLAVDTGDEPVEDTNKYREEDAAKDTKANIEDVKKSWSEARKQAQTSEDCRKELWVGSWEWASYPEEN